MVFRRDDCHRLVQIPLRTMKDRQGDVFRREERFSGIVDVLMNV